MVDSQAPWQAVDEGRLTACLPASSLTDIFYVARRLTDIARAQQAVQICLDALEIGLVDRSILERAQMLSGSDFKDNVLIACAELNGLEAIVTSDRVILQVQRSRCGRQRSVAGGSRRRRDGRPLSGPGGDSSMSSKRSHLGQVEGLLKRNPTFWIDPSIPLSVATLTCPGSSRPPRSTRTASWR